MNWLVNTLGELFGIARGGSPRPIDDYITDDPDGVNWIMISDASESSKYISKTRKRIRKEGVARSRLVKPGDFLLTNSMSFGKPYILDVHGCIHDGWLVLTPRDQEIYPDYFYHLLGSSEVYTEFARLAAGATVKNLNIDLVRNVRVRVPPIAEQRRVAAILDQAEALRAKRRASVGTLERLEQALFSELQKHGEANLHSIEELLNDGTLILHKDGNHGAQYPRADDFDDCGVAFLSVKAIGHDGEIKESEVDYLKESKAKLLRIGWIESGDVLLAHNASVGQVGIYRGQFGRALIGTSLTCLRPDPDRMMPSYLAAALRSSRFQQDLKKNMGQTTRNQVPITAQKRLKVLTVPFPAQVEFTRKISVVHSMRRRLNLSAEALDHAIASLQHRAFRGEL